MKIIFTRDFCALIISVAIVGLGIGATFPLTSIALMQAGYGSHVIGILTAAQAGGGLVIVPFVGRITSRIGAHCAITSMVWITSISTLLMQLTSNLVAWTFLRAISGAALMMLFTITEVWVHQLAPDRSRGRIVALYTTNFTLFQMAGPLLVSVIASYPGWRFALCASIFLLALPGLSIMRISPDMGQVGNNSNATRKTILPRMLAPIIGVGFFALFDTLALSLLPLFALHHGISTERAVVFGSAIALGETVCAFFLGWLADQVGRERIHFGAAIVVTLLLPTLLLVTTQPWLYWPVLILLGAASGGVYTLSLSAIGERFRGPSLVTASSLIGASWGIASFLGPIVAGLLMRMNSPDALIVVLFIGIILFICAHLWEQYAARAETQG
ncbi:MFS transporter [Candidatus Vallotia lariciata]|uniref:MFS transporter n=1 Tax=Candidatus Vallotia laricis TaxID=2018052 RepID=UPI001D0212BA|nr:MFS transporter [Candidatus Vallotia lariciata]UDG83256.1 putative MFS-type transporter YcaD [Candidatus Vallotia lariciata]